MKALYILSLLWLSACSPEPKYEKYVILYYQLTGDLYKGRVNEVDYKLSDQSNAVAWCSIGLNKEIFITKQYLNKASGLAIEQTMLHELAHCAGGVAHDMSKDTLDDGCPISIMNPYKIADSCYEIHRDYYLNELKGRKHEQH